VRHHLIYEHGIPESQVNAMSLQEQYALHDSIHDQGL
jgi:hypothetical protein